jgi:hypothetical protein
LARRDREILLVLAATMAVNGADMISWLFARRLVSGPARRSGCPLRGGWDSVVGGRCHRAAPSGGAARRSYVAGCLADAAGLVMLALAPDVIVGGIGLLLASGVAFSVTRVVSVIWVNRRTLSYQGDDSLLSLPGRDCRRGRRRPRAIGDRPGCGRLGGVHRLWCAHRVRRRTDSDPASEVRNGRCPPSGGVRAAAGNTAHSE